MSYRNPRNLLFQDIYSAVQPLPPLPTTTTTSSTDQNSEDQTSFDANIIMVLAVLLCALISALSLNAVIRCAFRCSTRIIVQHGGEEECGGGVKKKTLKSMPTMTVSDGMILPGSSGSECMICLSEFVTGDVVKFLPKCKHGFHVGCVDKWLAAHSSCPICRSVMSSGGCQKESRCADETAVTISPLDHEGPLYNYYRHRV
ncbi:RING-H2 finger protein ATL78 [Zostera marina]|uniref:RING-H2 finger protein ATL78 n=1 Tax=Zostera marina TaxID=29655 RepID=A0A0K9P9Y7_ZOSMR|nr:RING-H2 finger protein ATL78 [Zostera marina]